MEGNYDQLIGSRPGRGSLQEYSPTPAYVKREPYEDRLAILACQIKIWEAKDRKWFNIPRAGECLTIRECESIEATSSAKELIGKAVVKFPRGTVIRYSEKKDGEVSYGLPEDGLETTALLSECLPEELLTPSTAVFKEDGSPTAPLAPRYDLKGLVDFNRTKSEPSLLTPDSVAVGNRIEIRCGYAYSEEEFNQMNSSDGLNMDLVFTGFITAVSADAPLELECENMAYTLSTVSAPDMVAKNSLYVKDFFEGEDGLLEGTGIELAESSRNSSILVHGASITHNLTVADVLSEWSKSGVLCLMEDRPDGVSVLKIGLAYYAGPSTEERSLPSSDKKYITYNGGARALPIIQFDWDVASDKLGLIRNDKKFLAVEATGRTADNKFFKVTIRKNPDNDCEGWVKDSDDGWDLVNRQEVADKKSGKKSGGTAGKKTSRKKDRVDLKRYTVVHYQSVKPGITEKELVEEAKQYWASYSPNGISGSLEIFGDVPVRPTDIVGLVDPRQPEKNGYYYVESVSTSFGVGGYRRELKLPFKAASFAKPVEIIR